MKTINSNINVAIMENEIETKDWEMNRLASELYWWVDFFNIAFFKSDPIPTPVLTFERTRVNNLGYYRIGFNDFAVKNQININKLYINKPKSDVLQTLIHEMVHSWEHIYVPEKNRTKNWYHTKVFRSRLAKIGILADERGSHTAIGDPFVFLLKKHSVEFANKKKKTGGMISIPPITTPKGKSKLRKWTCNCQIARIGKAEFHATCNICGNQFKMNE